MTFAVRACEGGFSEAEIRELTYFQEQYFDGTIEGIEE